MTEEGEKRPTRSDRGSSRRVCARRRRLSPRGMLLPEGRRVECREGVESMHRPSRRRPAYPRAPVSLSPGLFPRRLGLGLDHQSPPPRAFPSRSAGAPARLAPRDLRRSRRRLALAPGLAGTPPCGTHGTPSSAVSPASIAIPPILPNPWRPSFDVHKRLAARRVARRRRRRFARRRSSPPRGLARARHANLAVAHLRPVQQQRRSRVARLAEEDEGDALAQARRDGSRTTRTASTNRRRRVLSIAPRSRVEQPNHLLLVHGVGQVPEEHGSVWS